MICKLRTRFKKVIILSAVTAYTYKRLCSTILFPNEGCYFYIVGRNHQR